MSERHLREMGIDAERAQAATDFLEVYADLCLSELDDVIDRDDGADEDREWTGKMDAATALRDAGEWALSFDPRRARELLDRAGVLFQQMGLPFGAYLKVVTGAWYDDPPVDIFAEALYSVASLQEPESEERERVVPAPLNHPQQQAYLLLASAAAPPIAREFQGVLRAIASESPQRVGVAPVGALGTPIRRFWRIANALLGTAESDAATVAEEVVAVADRYAEAIELARTNEYCWHNAAAPVDVGDIDIVGVGVLAGRHFGLDRMGEELERHLAGRHDLARAQIEIAMEVARADQR